MSLTAKSLSRFDWSKVEKVLITYMVGATAHLPVSHQKWVPLPATGALCDTCISLLFPLSRSLYIGRSSTTCGDDKQPLQTVERLSGNRSQILFWISLLATIIYSLEYFWVALCLNSRVPFSGAKRNIHCQYMFSSHHHYYYSSVQ